jgi:VWFA-related protein
MRLASPRRRECGPASAKPREGGRALAALIGSVLAALLAAPVTAQRQEPPPTPTFRAGVELVQIDAVVTDRAGNPVSGLTADDFELREQGKPRDIAAFATVDIPLEQVERPLYAPTAIEPDVASNSGPEGRVYVIVFDLVRADLALRTRHFLRRFIETQMGANDVAAIVYLGKGASHSQEFTSSRRLLLAQLEKFTGAFEPTPGVEAQLEMQSRMSTFRDIAGFLASIQGRRKAMLLVSTGNTLVDAYEVVDNNSTTIASDYLREAMVAATRGTVVIYPIDPRGLTVEGVDISDAAEPSPSGETGTLASRGNLHALARLTGGFAVTNTNRYEQHFERVVRENSSYYILGFYSANEKRDGQFRSVDVRVKRPGLEVRTRTGYVAPTNRTPRATARQSALTPAVSAALASALPVKTVGMKLLATPFKDGKDAIVSVAVEVDLASLDLTDSDGEMRGQLEVAITPTRGRDTLAGAHYVARLNLKRETYEIYRREGLRVVTDLRLKPGIYQIRASAGNRVSKAGSVIADIEVPDFRKPPLALSGVTITARHLPVALTAHTGRKLSPLPSPPSTTREFSSGDNLDLFVEIYDNVKTAHRVNATATLRADDGRVVATQSEEWMSRAGDTGGFGFRTGLPLSGATPGLYVIHIEARANAGDRPVASRDVTIRVK